MIENPEAIKEKIDKFNHRKIKIFYMAKQQ